MIRPFSTSQLASCFTYRCLALPSAAELWNLAAIQMEVAIRLLRSSQPSMSQRAQLDVPEHQQLLALLSRHWPWVGSVQANSTCACIVATSADRRIQRYERCNMRRRTKSWLAFNLPDCEAQPHFAGMRVRVQCSGCSWISTFFVKDVNQQPGKENALQCKIEWAK
jgi:hypothetical protein